VLLVEKKTHANKHKDKHPSGVIPNILLLKRHYKSVAMPLFTGQTQ
jgi:hypothetical protein